MVDVLEQYQVEKTTGIARKSRHFDPVLNRKVDEDAVPTINKIIWVRLNPKQSQKKEEKREGINSQSMRRY